MGGSYILRYVFALFYKRDGGAPRSGGSGLFRPFAPRPAALRARVGQRGAIVGGLRGLRTGGTLKLPITGLCGQFGFHLSG
jgi:hypothetical protein